MIMDYLPGDRRTFTLLGIATAALATIPVLYTVIRSTLKYKRLQRQYSSTEFVLAAGAIPFQFDASGVPKRVLLAHHAPRDAWLLSKGRKDEGEDLATTATREVFEETGYPCHLFPVPRLPTCAPPPTTLASAELHPHAARVAQNSTEPFMITLRPVGLRMLKLIFWYIGAVDVPCDPFFRSGESRKRKPGSHQDVEGFDEVGLFDIDEALEKLAFDGDRDLVRTAVSILTSDSV